MALTEDQKKMLIKGLFIRFISLYCMFELERQKNETSSPSSFQSPLDECIAIVKLLGVSEEEIKSLFHEVATSFSSEFNVEVSFVDRKKC